MGRGWDSLTVGVEEGRGAHRDDKGLHEEDLGHCVLEVRGAMLAHKGEDEGVCKAGCTS